MKIVSCALFFYFLTFSVHAQTSSDKPLDTFSCTPCGSDCDNHEYTAAGKCPHCQMPLVKKSTIHFGTISPSAICDYIKQHPDVVLLDVRTRKEFEGKATPDYGVLKDAINIPIQELQSQLPRISSLKNKEIIVYCSHSRRSPRASYLLTQNGFVNVTNMSGGLSVMTDTSCKK